MNRVRPLNKPFHDKVDVFLPGQGDSLTEAPAYQWVPADDVDVSAYRSTNDPSQILVRLRVEGHRGPLPGPEASVDLPGASRHNDIDGFSLHLPGLIVTSKGTAIAVCQKRHHSTSDCGNKIDILLSRSEDDARTWSPQTVIFEEEGVATILGSIFEDRETTTVFVTFWKMPADIEDDLGYFGMYAKEVGGFWMLKSNDEGKTWSEPFHVLPEPNSEGWVGWPNNCVHGIQLVSGTHAGRLVMPAFLFKDGEPGQAPGVRGGLLYSDDHAGTWKAGAVLRDGSDEVSLVETGGQGEIYLSHRMNTKFTGKRHFARSVDGGRTFYEIGQHVDLPDPRLHAGLIRYGDTVLFSSPQGEARQMTIALSRDESASWHSFRPIDGNLSRYSDLAATNDGTILCIYTNGVQRDRDKISVARFNIEWLNEQN